MPKQIVETIDKRIRWERAVTYLMWVVMAGILFWMGWTWQNYLSEKSEQTQQQVEYIKSLRQDSARLHRKMEILLDDFSDLSKAHSEAIERQEASRQKFRKDADAILEALGVAPAGREESVPAPAPKDSAPKPEPKASVPKSPRAPPTQTKPPEKKQPSAPKAQEPSHPGKSSPKGKAKGHSKPHPGKSKKK